MLKDPYHKARDSFRVLGPTMVVIGGLMLIIGVGQFILSMIQAMSGGNAKPPILFVALGVPGLLIFGIGMQLTGVGFLKQTTKLCRERIRSGCTDHDHRDPFCDPRRRHTVPIVRDTDRTGFQVLLELWLQGREDELPFMQRIDRYKRSILQRLWARLGIGYRIVRPHRVSCDT